MRVAVDLEEVLADTIQESCRSTDKLSHEDFYEWDLDSRTWQIYSGVSDALWRHDPLSIPPVEDSIGAKMQPMYDAVDELNIVTARMHVDEYISDWLDHHDVPRDNIISTREPKYYLDYDVFIDDNPEMHGQCRLLLRSHPHNSFVEAANSKSTDRIHSLLEAQRFIR